MIAINVLSCTDHRYCLPLNVQLLQVKALLKEVKYAVDQNWD